MTSVLWVSRHAPLQGQRDELSRLFGEVNLTLAPEASVTETLARYEALPEPRELVLVAPLAICREVLKRNVKPLCPMMTTVTPTPAFVDAYREVQQGVRVVRFTHFQRRVSVRETFEPVRSQRQ